MEKPKLEDYLFAGYLTDPTRSSIFVRECGFENIDVTTLLLLLKRNKVPSIFFDQYFLQKYPRFFNSAEFKAHYEKEHSEFKCLRNEWDQVRKEFLEAGIETMFIKSVGYFPFNSSNLDVLIKQSKRELAESILKDMGYIQLHNVEEPFKTLFRKFSGGKSTSVIHLHNKVAWMNPFHDENLLWRRCRNSSKDNLIVIPSPEDSILILTAHWFYEDKEIKLSDIMSISTCLKDHNVDWDYLTAVAGKFGWLNGFYFALLVQSFVEKNIYGDSLIDDDQLERIRALLPDWMCKYLDKRVYPREIALPFKLPKMFGKILHFVKTFKDNTTTLSRKFYEMYVVGYGSLFVVLFETFRLNIRYQPSMLISISGVDGSGKSTYAKNLLDILVFSELRTRVVWSRVGSSGFLKPFSKLANIFYRAKKGKINSEDSDNFRESGARRKDMFEKSAITRTLGLTLLLLEMLLQYFFRVALPLFSNKVVICDRYVYDTLVDITTRYGVNPNTKEGKIFTKILTMLTPKPDIAYVLLISFEEACRRKNVDTELKHLVRDQINSYENIAETFNLRKIHTENKTRITDIFDNMLYEIFISYYYGKWYKS